MRTKNTIQYRGILTSDWHAREDICRCSCGGRNHGILRNGGEQPERTSRKGRAIYKLIAITNVFDCSKIVNEVVTLAGSYCENDGYYPLRYARQASNSQSRWSEVVNMLATDYFNPSNACIGDKLVYLVWERISLAPVS